MDTFKIGELAKVLGVTPDFLKHYEQYGIIHPTIAESGYRYYRFADAVLIFECLKYKRWDLSIKDMKALMSSKDLDDYFENMDIYAERVRKNMSLDDIMLYDLTCNEKRFGKELNEWFISSAWNSYFVPHTRNKTLINDEDTIDVVSKWMKLLPVSRECCYVPLNGYEMKDELYWGFFLPSPIYDDFVEHTDKEINILNQRFFEMNVCYEFDSVDSEESMCKLVEKTMNIMKEHNLIPDGYFVFNIHFDLTDTEHHRQYGVIRVPIK